MIEAIELTSMRRSRAARGGPVEKVSFDVYPGQVTALLGAPGTGKSTVLRLMVELEPGSGRTLFGGRPFRALRPAIREVGLALNPDAVHPGRTVQAHLQLYSAAGGVPKGRVAEVLEVAGLSTQATVRCGRLDPGQRQRLSIAAALVGDPAALILDEPRALDSHGMSWFHALIRAYAVQGRTVLVAATDPDSLSGTADHVVILRRDEHDGVSRVIASRSAAEVFDEHRVGVVQVRSPQAARLAAALESEGARLSPAGPGALQVRGLDRARIGEVAHVAGICLHELSEIDHDDDIFGLRPVPRQKELLPGLNRAGAIWPTGIRPADEIEEAEVVEATGTADMAEAVPQPVTPSVGAQVEGTGATMANSGAIPLDVDNQTTEAAMRLAETHLSESTIASPRDEVPTIASPDQPAAQPSAKARWGSQSSQWWAVKSVGDQAQTGPSAEAGADGDAEESISGPVSTTERAARPSSPSSPTVARAWRSSERGSTATEWAVGARNVTAPRTSSWSAPASTATDPAALSTATEQGASLSAPASAMAESAARPTATVRSASWNTPANTSAPSSSTSALNPSTSAPANRTATASQPVPTAANQVPAAPSSPPPSAEPPSTEPPSTELPSTDASESQPSAKLAETLTTTRIIEAPAPALRRSSTFGLRWGRERPAGPQSEVVPPAAQPAVPFTVTASTVVRAEEVDGMTPWRAVAVRAAQQNQQQVSVAEAAPAEQETSA